MQMIKTDHHQLMCNLPSFLPSNLHSKAFPSMSLHNAKLALLATVMSAQSMQKLPCAVRHLVDLQADQSSCMSHDVCTITVTGLANGVRMVWVWCIAQSIPVYDTSLLTKKNHTRIVLLAT